MANHAIAFFKNNSQEKRNFTGVTTTLSEAQYEEVVQELSDFRKKILHYLRIPAKKQKSFILICSFSLYRSNSSCKKKWINILA
jgi:hypothetical protein